MWQSHESMPRPQLLMWLVTNDKPAWPCQVLQRNGDDWRVRLFGPAGENPIFFNARANELFDYASNMQLAAVSNPANRARLALACSAAHAYVRQSGDRSQRASLESPAFEDIVRRLQSSEPPVFTSRRMDPSLTSAPIAPSEAVKSQAREQVREANRIWYAKKDVLAKSESALNSARNELLEARERLAQAELAVLGAKCASSAAEKKVQAKQIDYDGVKDEVALLDVRRQAAYAVLHRLGERERDGELDSNRLLHERVVDEPIVIDAEDNAYDFESLRDVYDRKPNNQRAPSTSQAPPSTRKATPKPQPQPPNQKKGTPKNNSKSNQKQGAPKNNSKSNQKQGANKNNSKSTQKKGAPTNNSKSNQKKGGPNNNSKPPTKVENVTAEQSEPAKKKRRKRRSSSS